MYLGEAVKSGKHFKRPTHEYWFIEFICEFSCDHYIVGGEYKERAKVDPIYLFNDEDILADDWETKED